MAECSKPSLLRPHDDLEGQCAWDDVSTGCAASVARLDAEAIRKVTPCGMGSMAWRVWGKGRPLVLLHGANGSWTHWIRNIVPLATSFRVLVPDLPGFGDSDMPPEPHTAEMLADLVASGVDAVLPASMELDMAGFSFGGIIAGLAAARLGRRVRSLVLLGPAGLGLGRGPSLPSLKIRSEMTPTEIVEVHKENLRVSMFADPRKIDDLAVFLHMDNARRSRFKWGAIPASDVLRRSLPAIRAHISAIYGGRDAIIGSDLSGYRKEYGSIHHDLDFRVIPGVGHWLNYEAAEEINALMVKLLQVNR